MMTYNESMEMTGEIGALFEAANGIHSHLCPEDDMYGEYKGFNFLVRRSEGLMNSWYCAYIEVSVETDTQNVRCPWGISFGDFDGRPMVRKWPDKTLVKEGFKIIGWDYNHRSLDDHDYTFEEVHNDIRWVLNELMKGGD